MQVPERMVNYNLFLHICKEKRAPDCKHVSLKFGDLYYLSLLYKCYFYSFLVSSPDRVVNDSSFLQTCKISPDCTICPLQTSKVMCLDLQRHLTRQRFGILTVMLTGHSNSYVERAVS